MNNKEILEALLRGQKLAHPDWGIYEYVHIVNNNLVDECDELMDDLERLKKAAVVARAAANEASRVARSVARAAANDAADAANAAADANAAYEEELNKDQKQLLYSGYVLLNTWADDIVESSENTYDDDALQILSDFAADTLAEAGIIVPVIPDELLEKPGEEPVPE